MYAVYWMGKVPLCIKVLKSKDEAINLAKHELNQCGGWYKVYCYGATVFDTNN